MHAAAQCHVAPRRAHTAMPHPRWPNRWHGMWAAWWHATRPSHDPIDASDGRSHDWGMRMRVGGLETALQTRLERHPQTVKLRRVATLLFDIPPADQGAPTRPARRLPTPSIALNASAPWSPPASPCLAPAKRVSGGLGRLKLRRVATLLFGTKHRRTHASARTAAFPHAPPIALNASLAPPPPSTAQRDARSTRASAQEQLLLPPPPATQPTT